VDYGLIQHGMQEMNPLVRIRLGHANELPLHFLNGVLFHIRQHKEECLSAIVGKGHVSYVL
jgi:hypothetical protein